VDGMLPVGGGVCLLACLLLSSGVYYFVLQSGLCFVNGFFTTFGAFVIHSPPINYRVTIFVLLGESPVSSISV
jgi:hypothetical protein